MTLMENSLCIGNIRERKIMTTDKTTFLDVKPGENSVLDKLRQDAIELNKLRKKVMEIYQEQISFSEQISAAVV